MASGDPVALAGVDEAGRGPVIGPLVVAAVAGGDPARLHELGCRDSKKLHPGKRQAAWRALQQEPGLTIAVEVVSAEELDAQRRAGRTLNEIGLEAFAKAIEATGAAQTGTEVLADAADVDAARFGRTLSARLGGLPVTAEHKADDRHPHVAAASIVAKVRRDDEVAKLARRLERRLDRELGSGYPSDPKTRGFLAAWLERYGTFPEGTRTTWSTCADLLAAHQTPRLDAFGGAGPADNA
ncbi:MAG: ribonuclease HII [Thermoplasmatota archaeon]